MKLPPQSGTYTITPRQAESWLERNPEHNRTMSQSKVAAFELAMREGRFRLTHQGIAFDKNGRLLDGQKRLQAIVNTGLPQRMRIFINEDPDNFAFIDTGQGRTAQQFVGGSYKVIRSSAARILLQAEFETFGGVAVPMELVLTMAEDWEPELSEYAPIVKRVSRETPMPPSVLLAVVVQLSPDRNEYGGSLDDFIELFFHGTGQKNPVGTLLRRAQRDHAVWSGGSAHHMPYRCIVAAWNAYVEGKMGVRLPVLKNIPTPNSDLPVILGRK